MSELKDRAEAILKEFKGDRYAFGSGVLDEAPGNFAAEFGKKALVIGSTESDWFQPTMGRILKSLASAGLEVVGTAKSAAPNAPFVDVYRLHSHIVHKNPQLDMKLRNMPVPLNADLIDEYMRPILEAAWSGEFEKIKPMYAEAKMED